MKEPLSRFRSRCFVLREDWFGDSPELLAGGEAPPSPWRIWVRGPRQLGRARGLREPKD